MKKEKYLCIEFHNAEGETVKELTKCPATPEDVLASLKFLRIGCDVVVTIQEITIHEDGSVETPFETFKP